MRLFKTSADYADLEFWVLDLRNLLDLRTDLRINLRMEAG